MNKCSCENTIYAKDYEIREDNLYLKFLCKDCGKTHYKTTIELYDVKYKPLDDNKEIKNMSMVELADIIIKTHENSKK